MLSFVHRHERIMFLFTLYGHEMFSSSTTITLSLIGHHDILMKITDYIHNLQLNRNRIILKTVLVLGELGGKCAETE